MKGAIISDISAIEKLELPEVDTSRDALIQKLRKIKEKYNLDVNIEAKGYCIASSHLYGYFKLLKKGKYIENLTKLICMWDGQSDIKNIALEYFNLFELAQNSFEYLSEVQQSQLRELINFVKSDDMPSIHKVSIDYPCTKEDRDEDLTKFLQTDKVLFIESGTHIICAIYEDGKYYLHDSENNQFEQKFENINDLESAIVESLYKDDKDETYLPIVMSSYELDNADKELSLSSPTIETMTKERLKTLPQNILNKLLYLAAIQGEIDMGRELLALGANPNYLRNGTSPLYIASQNGHKEMVILLLKNNADPNILTSDLFSPLYIAAKYNHEDIVKILLEHKADFNIPISKLKTNPFFHAAFHNYVSPIRTFLKFKTLPIDTADRFGNTALHVAAKKDFLEIIVMLIEAKANINAQTLKGMTPLHMAAEAGNVKAVQYLIENGADTSLTDEKNRTALQIVEENSNYTDSSIKESLLELLSTSAPKKTI